MMMMMIERMMFGCDWISIFSQFSDVFDSDFVATTCTTSCSAAHVRIPIHKYVCMTSIGTCDQPPSANHSVRDHMVCVFVRVRAHTQTLFCCALCTNDRTPWIFRISSFRSSHENHYIRTPVPTIIFILHSSFIILHHATPVFGCPCPRVCRVCRRRCRRVCRLPCPSPCCSSCSSTTPGGMGLGDDDCDCYG